MCKEANVLENIFTFCYLHMNYMKIKVSIQGKCG